ncbi:MAG: TlpA family protein disulfide reductase, partial [Planctomycetales bacterium]|nr:TlpA family protein disulfide reductase [Planctomycetales bacterium]
DDRLNRLLTRRLGARPKATTHVLRAFNGDSLRGQLLSVHNNTVTFKARLDTISIPLDKVAELIALRDTDDKKKTPPFSLELHGGSSVAIKPVQVTDGLMIGESPLIGRIAVPWQVVSQMNVVGTFQRSMSDLIAWTLKEPPALPDFLNPTAPPAPTQSPMVGKLAPDLELEMLDGEKVSLSDLRGKTVVLDFWATWCGPCVASLPRVMEVAAGFDDDVVLIAVNQQEDPDDIKTFLASHDWDSLTVALDADLVAGRSYRVEGIPHTVIIDREGIVRNVHVGASADLATALSDEIEATLAEDK